MILLFPEIALALLGPVHFHINFRITLPISTKNPVEVLFGVALNLWINLGEKKMTP